jgi:hypothetical protein
VRLARTPQGPVRILLRPSLRAWRGKLLTGEGPGTAVHAGAFLRKREIVLDAALLAQPKEAGRILIHEIYHFVWTRLSNAARRSYEVLLSDEIRAGASGELGWSAEWRKNALAPRDVRTRSRRWREYVCESFCDTAAWISAGGGRHGEFTLPSIPRRRRRAWFHQTEELGRISL